MPETVSISEREQLRGFTALPGDILLGLNPLMMQFTEHPAFPLMTLSVVELSLIGTISLVVLKALFFPRRARPLPPGPKGLPLVGNLFNFPAVEEWIVFKDLGEQYNSDIIYYNVAGQDIVVVNTIEAANELFIKRSSIYSDKPSFLMLTTMVGFKWHFAFYPYGEQWKEHRKVFHKSLEGPVLAAVQHPHILDSARYLLRRIRDKPDRFMEDLRLYAGQIILRIAYGIEVLDDTDPFIIQAEKGMHALSIAGRAGAFLVDTWPILRFVPSWVPGAGFKTWAKEANKSVTAMRDAPLKFVEKAVIDGTAQPSVGSQILSEFEEAGTDTEENKFMLGNVLASAYAAGSDTTVAALATAILAMVQNPDILKHVQVDIDNIVGHDRLPDFSDRKELPYLEALVKEVLRWRLVLPLAVPHRVTQDDEYGGFHIPKGATIVGNAWAILHNKVVYGDDVEKFNPDRFLNADSSLNRSIPHPSAAFGFGRRICVGQDIAEDSIWIGMASMFAAFDIRKAIDKQGRVIEPSGEFTSGMLCHPVPFKCSITPRSRMAEALIA
ncbi:cytochrome P450 [Mucidula mucida]|nr:cytochrome P450 [Mucidula mucida]